MQRHIPDSIKEEQEIVPGGDLRRQGNQWLRKAWDSSKCFRVPREAECRKVVGQLVNLLDICIFDQLVCFLYRICLYH